MWEILETEISFSFSLYVTSKNALWTSILATFLIYIHFFTICYWGWLPRTLRAAPFEPALCYSSSRLRCVVAPHRTAARFLVDLYGSKMKQPVGA